MARRTALTQDRIDQAAARILKRGDFPTVAALRLELGEGSSPTIARFASESLAVRAARANKTESPASEEEDALLLEALKEQTKRLVKRMRQRQRDSEA
jgi:hypothetical protein